MTLSLRAVVSLVTVLVVAMAIAETVRMGLVGVPELLAFGLLVVIGELLRVAAPGGRQFAPLAAGVGIAYAFLPVADPAVYHAQVSQAIAVTAVGVLVGAVPRLVVDGNARLDAMADRVLSVTAAVVVLRFAASWLPAGVPTGVPVALLTGVLLVRFGFDSLLAAAYAYAASGGRLRTLVRDEAAARVPFHLISGLLAVIFALAVDVVGLVGLVVAVMPVAATQSAILRWSTIRRTRMETVRSLSRIPELGGYVEPGHTRRVGALVQGIARELGMPEGRTRNLYLAAIMHGIGQVSLYGPAPGDDTARAEEGQRTARRGAEVIREAGGLDEVAAFVERSADPYRLPDGRRDPHVPLESRIIKVASAYDHLVGESTDPDRRLAAIERVELELSRGHDPEVTAALARLVERRQRLPVA